MTTDENARVWALIERVSICTLATCNGSQIHARPMSARAYSSENCVYFLTDVRHQKDDEIERFPTVTLVFADPGSQIYVSVIGKAEVSNDRGKIKQLWSVSAKPFWQSPDDPNIRVLKVRPQSAEFWDSPGTLVSYAKMALAAVSDMRPELGNNAKVAM
jgi:general stress protein 26